MPGIPAGTRPGPVLGTLGQAPPHYDSLVGKLIVHASDRSEALALMRRALDELVIEGIETTIPLHRRIFRNGDFIEGRVDTTWVERVLMAPKNRPSPE